jgi:hypothetical protein
MCMAPAKDSPLTMIRMTRGPSAARHAPGEEGCDRQPGRFGFLGQSGMCDGGAYHRDYIEDEVQGEQLGGSAAPGPPHARPRLCQWVR